MRSWGLSLVLAACLLFTGCGADSSVHTGAGAAHGKPTLDVKLTVTGNQVVVKVDTDMHISAEHQGQERVQGEGHIHMYLDNGEKVVVAQAEQTLKDVPVGKHTLKVSLHNNDHTPYDVTKSIDFEIK
ncbi:hypothetical protein [Paenibacillus sp. HJGM_3]|uniref:hypothetical protein n=1 Tax=Paenibacillus sp. HJGM_3 TaxID=3379816 RepID=UPI003857F987